MLLQTTANVLEGLVRVPMDSARGQCTATVTAGLHRGAAANLAPRKRHCHSHQEYKSVTMKTTNSVVVVVTLLC